MKLFEHNKLSDTELRQWMGSKDVYLVCVSDQMWVEKLSESQLAFYKDLIYTILESKGEMHYWHSSVLLYQISSFEALQEGFNEYKEERRHWNPELSLFDFLIGSYPKSCLTNVTERMLENYSAITF